MQESPCFFEVRPRHGFTLIEMLVSVSIIIILAAILIPVVGKFQDGAAGSKTIGNLRSLQTANISYAADHNGFYVPNWPASSAAYQNGWWQFGEFVDYLGESVREGTENLGWDFWPKVAKTGKTVNPLLNSGGDKKDRYGTIAMNMSRFSHWTSGTPMAMYANAHFRVGMLRQSAVAHPNDLIMFADGAGYYVDFVRRMEWANLPDQKRDEESSNGLAFRYPGDVAYVVVASGAVKALRPSDITDPTPEVQRMFYYNGAQ